MFGRDGQHNGASRPGELYSIPARRLPPGPGILGPHPQSQGQNMMVPPPRTHDQFNGYVSDPRISYSQPPFRGELQHNRILRPTPNTAHDHVHVQGSSYNLQTGGFYVHPNFYPSPENFYCPPFPKEERDSHQHQYLIRHQQGQGQVQGNNNQLLNTKMNHYISSIESEAETEPTNDSVNRKNAAVEFRKRVQEAAQVEPAAATLMKPSREKKAIDFKITSPLMIKVSDSDFEVFDETMDNHNFNHIEEEEEKEDNDQVEEDSDDSSIVSLKEEKEEDQDGEDSDNSSIVSLKEEKIEDNLDQDEDYDGEDLDNSSIVSLKEEKIEDNLDQDGEDLNDLIVSLKEEKTDQDGEDLNDLIVSLKEEKTDQDGEDSDNSSIVSLKYDEDEDEELFILEDNKEQQQYIKPEPEPQKSDEPVDEPVLSMQTCVEVLMDIKAESEKVREAFSASVDFDNETNDEEHLKGIPASNTATGARPSLLDLKKRANDLAITWKKFKEEALREIDERLKEIDHIMEVKNW